MLGVGVRSEVISNLSGVDTSVEILLHKRRGLRSERPYSDKMEALGENLSPSYFLNPSRGASIRVQLRGAKNAIDTKLTNGTRHQSESGSLIGYDVN